MIRALLFSLSLFLFSQAFAGAPVPCSSRDLSSRFGPVRGSGGAQWCWANSSADYIGFLQGVQPPDRVSTIDVATATLSTSAKDFLKTVRSLDDKALTRIGLKLQYGLSTDQVRMGVTSLDDIQSSSVVAIVAYQSGDGLCLESAVGVETEPSNSYIRDYIKSITNSELIASGQKPCDLRTSAARLGSFAFDLNNKVLADVRSEMNRKCRPRRQLRAMIPEIVDFNAAPNRGPANEMIKNVINHDLPVMIGLDSHVLTGGRYSNQDADHAALIVGTRENQGRCEYLLRDGNGPSCQIYRQEIRPRCSEGMIWLTEDEINQSVQTVMIAEPKS